MVSQILFIVLFALSGGCKRGADNRTLLTSAQTNLGTPISGNFFSDDDSLCVLARNATNATRELAIVLPSENEGILIPFGKPWASNGSGAPEIGQSFYQVKILGGIRSAQAVRVGNWNWMNDATKFGGGYYNGTTGSITFQTHSGVTRIGIYDIPVSSSGVFLVEIDGDRTLANHLPTADALVANGTLSASFLVAQGGNLNPTDRIYYQKSPAGTSLIPASTSGMDNMLTQNRRVRIASNLSAGIHTVKFVQSGYSASGSQASNLRISGIWFDSPQTGIGDPNIGFEIKANQEMHCPSSDNNFAFRFCPNGLLGSGQYEWLGHNNGSQIKSGSCQLSLDGILFSDIPMGTLRKTKTLTLTVPGSLKHPGVSDPVASYSQKYTISAQAGIECESSIQWNEGGHISLGYIPQLAAFEPINKGTVWEASQNYMLDQNNDANRYNQKGTQAYIWSPVSNWAMLLQSSIQDTIWLADRSDQYNKIYFRHYNNAIIQPGDALNVLSNYRFKKMEQADLSLSK